MGISTIFTDLPMVGKIGHSFGEINRNFLGYIGYVYPFLLIYPAYKIYKNEIINIKNIPLFGISLIFLIISILTFQGLMVDKEAGVLSEELYNFFSQYIGKFGTILFIIISFILSANTLFDISIDEVVQKNKDKIANNLKNSILNFNIESSSDKELSVMPAMMEIPFYQRRVWVPMTMSSSPEASPWAISFFSLAV